MASSGAVASAWGALALILAGCGAAPDQQAWIEQVAFPKAEIPEAMGAANLAAEAALGARIYRAVCQPCHGVRGDGQGPAAAAFVPRPRDFTKGLFKFRSTSTGELPTDRDLAITVARGLPGTAMPGWAGQLTPAEGRAVVQYVKSFYPSFFDPDFAPGDYVIAIGDPPAVTPALIEQGRAVYEEPEKAACVKCHGPTGAGDGPEAGTQKDDWGYTILPFDLTRGDLFKHGPSVRSIYKTLSTGLNGTPMPGYADTFSEAERWALAHYVATFTRPRSWVRYLLDEPSWEEPLLRQQTKEIKP